MITEKGLQKERTHLSWLRTRLVLFGMGFVFFRLSISNSHILTAFIGSVAMIIAIGFSLPTSYMTKRIISTLSMLMACTYLCVMVSKFFV